jgi:hypothetical protein
VRVEVTGNVTIQAKQQGKFRVSLNKLIATEVRVIEELEEGFRAKKTVEVANKTDEERKVFDKKPVVAKPTSVPVLENDDDLPF